MFLGNNNEASSFTNRRTLVFDLDGTLLNTLLDLANSTNHALQESGMPQRTLDEVRRFVGNGVHRLMERAIPEGEANPRFEVCYACFRKYYAKHCLDLTQPYPGIEEMLSALHQNGYRLAIVSNKFDLAVKELNRHFFPNYIPVAIGERDGVRRKPAPDTVLTALSELGSKVSDAIYVGDSEVDLETAVNAKVPCISVAWGFKGFDFLMQHGARVIVDEPSEILTLLNLK